MTALAGLLALLVGLGGCATVSSQAGGESEPEVEGIAAPLVEYRQSGTIQGLDDHLIVTADGTGLLTTREGTSDVRLGESELERLRDVLTAAETASLDQRYAPPGGLAVPDSLQWSVIAEGKEIEVVGGADVPRGLERLQRHLEALVEAYRRS